MKTTLCSFLLCFLLISVFYAQNIIPEQPFEDENFIFIDKKKTELLARQQGFDTRSKQKGFFTVSVNQKKIPSIYPPLMASSDTFKIFHRITADSFGVSTYSIESLESVSFNPVGRHYLSSFGKYGAYIWITSMAVAALAEEDVDALFFYNLTIGLSSLPIIALSGLLATTFPASYIFDGKNYFEESRSRMWEFGLSFGELPRKYWSHENYEYVKIDSIWISTDYGGYWATDWVKKKLPNYFSTVGMHLNYQNQFLPFKGSLSLYYVSLENVNGEDYDMGNFVKGQKGDFGLVVYPSIITPVFQKDKLQGNISLGLLSQIEFLKGNRRLQDYSSRIWSGGEFELQYYLKPKWVISITKPYYLFKIENNRQPPIFLGLKYSPNYQTTKNSLNFEQISIGSLTQRISRPYAKKPTTLYGFNLDVRINPDARVSYGIYTLNKEKYNKGKKFYTIKYRKYSNVFPRLKAGTLIGFGFSDEFWELSTLAGPIIEFEINQTFSFWSAAEINVFELIYTMLNERTQFSRYISAGISINPSQLLNR